jgi:hypothetical protein
MAGIFWFLITLSSTKLTAMLLHSVQCRYGGGRAGLSDTMAGMFWVLDALCEMAKAGAGGFHLHWGIGGAPDGTMGQPNTGVQTNFFYKVGDQRLDPSQLKPQGVSAA